MPPEATEEKRVFGAAEFRSGAIASSRPVSTWTYACAIPRNSGAALAKARGRQSRQVGWRVDLIGRRLVAKEGGMERVRPVADTGSCAASSRQLCLRVRASTAAVRAAARVRKEPRGKSRRPDRFVRPEHSVDLDDAPSLLPRQAAWFISALAPGHARPPVAAADRSVDFEH